MRNSFGILLALLFSACAALGQFQSTFLCDMEQGTSASMVTTQALWNSTFRTASGFWSNSPATQTQLYFTNAYDLPLRGPVTVNGTNHLDSEATKSFVAIVNNTLHAFVTWHLNTPQPRVSCGWYGSLRNPSRNWNNLDVVRMDGGGEYSVCAYRDDGSVSPGPAFRAHANFNDNDVGADIVTTSNKVYWFCLLWDKNLGTFGQSVLGIYDPDTWLLVGDFSFARFKSKQNCSDILIGRTDEHSHSGDNYAVSYDDIIIDETGASWPLLPAGATVKASSTSRTAFDQAYTNAVNIQGTNRDIVLLPAGRSFWYPTYQLRKSFVLSGSGSNYITWLTNNIPIGTGGQLWDVHADEELFDLSAKYITISNMTISGIRWSTNYWGYGIVVKSNSCRISNVLFEHIRNPVFFRTQEGLMDHCITRGSWHIGRTYGVVNGSGTASWDQLWPIAFNSTNHCQWEDDVWESTTQNPIPSIAGWTSQQGDCFSVRHCTVILNMPSQSWSPLFDQHGDHDPSLRGGLSMIVASNRFIFSAGAKLDGPFIDLRGGQMLAYSNYMTGEGDLSNSIRLREEFDPPADGVASHTDVVTNTYVWENWQDATHLFSIDIPNPTPGSVPAGLNSGNYIHLGVEYFTNAPGTLSVLPYPHYLTGLTTPAGSGGGTEITNAIATGLRIRGVRIR